MRVAVGGLHFEHAVADVEDRHVEGAAAQVEHQDRLVGFLLKPVDSAAAVGSLMMRSTSTPAIRPASFVAWRCASLKYAGTVITALVTRSPR